MKSRENSLKFIRRLSAVIMSVALILAFSITDVSLAASMGRKVSLDDPSQVQTGRQLDVSKSKTATNLKKNSNGDWTSEIALTLPSEEETLTSDIVFVMDKSSCREETASKTEDLLSSLRQALAETGSSVKIAMVAFDGTGHVLYPLKEFTGTEEQISQITALAGANSIPQDEKIGGTNMHAGLLAAKEILDGDSSVKAGRKHMVMVSDGLTRLFTGSDGDVKDIYYRGAHSNNFLYGMIGEWSTLRFGNEAFNPPADWNWTMYWDQVQQWVNHDGDTYVHSFKVYGNSASDDEGTKVTDLESFKHLTDEGEDSADKHAMVVDRAVYEAYKTYETLVDSGYRCYVVNVGTSGFGDAFLGALNNLSGNSADVDFSQIRNEILYLVGPGSKVIDVMGTGDGADFDLIDPEKMILRVETTKGVTDYPAVALGDNRFGFKPDENGRQDWYEFVVTYHEKETEAEKREYFEWDIDVPITNFEHVSLIYDVKLSNPKSAPGTYGEYDRDGSKNYNGLHTNDEAYILANPYYGYAELRMARSSVMDGQFDEGIRQYFPRPTVSYTIQSPYIPPAEPTRPEEHTVTFHPNNGQSDFTQTVPDGGKAVRPEDPLRNGYSFDGWYTDSSYTKVYDFTAPVKSNLELYGKWSKTNVPVKPAKPKPKKVSGILLPKVIASGKHKQTLTWTALTNVDGYFIYMNHCDEGKKLHPFKKVADYKALQKRVYVRRNLKTYHNYKYYVAAYKIRNGKKVIVRNSVTVHSVCGNTSFRSTNVRSVKVKKHAVTLKKGQRYTIKASISKFAKNRALLDSTHCGKIRFLSRDSGTASVGYADGIVRAKKAGKTTIYVLGINGIRDKVVITVKA